MDVYTVNVSLGSSFLVSLAESTTPQAFNVNLLIFTAGRLVREAPPIIAPDAEVPSGVVANALPQALILTAIVISFSFFAFLLVLAFRAYQDLGTDDTDAMRIAEPVADPGPPEGY